MSHELFITLARQYNEAMVEKRNKINSISTLLREMRSKLNDKKLATTSLSDLVRFSQQTTECYGAIDNCQSLCRNADDMIQEVANIWKTYPILVWKQYTCGPVDGGEFEAISVRDAQKITISLLKQLDKVLKDIDQAYAACQAANQSIDRLIAGGLSDGLASTSFHPASKPS